MESTDPRLYPLILDALNEGVLTVDPELRVTSLNRAGADILGVEPEDAVGRRCYEVFRSDRCQEGCAVKRTLATGEPLRDQRMEILDADMEPVPVAVATAALRGEDGTLMGAVEVFSDLREVEALRRELSGTRTLGDLVGASPAMRELFRLIPVVADSDATVLVEGPSGTGKELVARALHEHSPRAGGPFVTLNCGALPDTLLESELFGHRRGAFTDAREDREGLLDRAAGGTLFLDEIGDTSPAFQVKLLRVLQEGEYRPLGSTETRKADARVVAATHRDLAAMVEAGSFRQDLYYRLRVIPLRIPALAERREDIAPLVERLMERLRARTGKAIEAVSEPALRVLVEHDYPGNVRELENLLERAFVLCRGRTIERRHLPPELLGGAAAAGGKGLRPSERAILAAETPAGDARRRSPEARKLVEVLEAHNWNRTATALALGIGRNTLWRRMREYGLLKSGDRED